MTRIVFVSCCRYEAFQRQPWWADIEYEDPDYLFLLGDMIYMDYGLPFFSKEPNGSPKNLSEADFRATMERKYHQQWEQVPEFKRLFTRMKDRNAVFGVWDDHDFAWNNACGEGASKDRVPDSIMRISRELFLRHLPSSTNKPELYFAIDIPDAKVIFLDNRSYATRPDDTNPHLMGDKQFQYLADNLDPDKLNLICAGLTLTHGKEQWSNYEREYADFCNLVKNIPYVVFIAGDIHKNKFESPSKDRPCHEVISSGIAVNYLGLPIGIDDIHNWGMLDISDSGIDVTFVNKRKGRTVRRINRQ